MPESAEKTPPLDLLATTEAGNRIGRSAGYVAQLSRSGKLPAFATAGRQHARLVTTDAVDDFTPRRDADRAARASGARGALRDR